MAKYRGRKIAGVSIANPRLIMKKVARARAYASLHCSDGLKDESMKILRSFADSTISTDLNEDFVLLGKHYNTHE